MTEAARNLSEQEMADLAALADGTLPAERRPAVEAWVAASPELQELLDRQRSALAATQSLAEEPVSESLRAAVEAHRPARKPRRGPLGGLVPRLAMVGVAALAVAAVLAVVLTEGPGAPSVAEAAQVGTQAPSGPAPGPADEGGTKLALDVEGVVFPDFVRSYGWEAVGMRRDELDGRTATTVFYEKEGRRIAYVIVSGSGLPRPSEAEGTTREGVLYQTLRVDGRLAVTWRRLGHTCVLIGPVPQDELLTLASWRGDGTLRY